MIIPWEQIDPATLYDLFESFVQCDGTDYGEQEQSQQQKIADVLR